MTVQQLRQENKRLRAALEATKLALPVLKTICDTNGWDMGAAASERLIRLVDKALADSASGGK